MGRFFGCSKTLIDKEYYAKKRYWLSLITFEILARQNLYQERRKTAIWPLRDVHGRPNLDSSKELVELYKIPLKTRKIGISLHKSLKPHIVVTASPSRSLTDSLQASVLFILSLPLSDYYLIRYEVMYKTHFALGTGFLKDVDCVLDVPKFGWF